MFYKLLCNSEPLKYMRKHHMFRNKMRHRLAWVDQRRLGCLNTSTFWVKYKWPLNSLDLNPLDYHVWNVIERKSFSYGDRMY